MISISLLLLVFSLIPVHCSQYSLEVPFFRCSIENTSTYPLVICETVTSVYLQIDFTQYESYKTNNSAVCNSLVANESFGISLSYCDAMVEATVQQWLTNYLIVGSIKFRKQRIESLYHYVEISRNLVLLHTKLCPSVRNQYEQISGEEGNHQNVGRAVSNEKEASYITSILDTSQSRLVVLVHVDSIDIILSTLVSMTQVKLVLFSTCDDVQLMIDLQVLLFEFSSERLEVKCIPFLESEEIVSTFDPVVVDTVIINGNYYYSNASNASTDQYEHRGDDQYQAQEALEAIRLSRLISKSNGGILLMLGCEACTEAVNTDVMSPLFTPSQSWKHAESIGLIKSSPSYISDTQFQPFCMGRFPENSIKTPDNRNILLDIIQPKHMEQYFGYPNYIEVKFELQIQNCLEYFTDHSKRGIRNQFNDDFDDGSSSSMKSYERYCKHGDYNPSPLFIQGVDLILKAPHGWRVCYYVQHAKYESLQSKTYCQYVMGPKVSSSPNLNVEMPYSSATVTAIDKTKQSEWYVSCWLEIDEEHAYLFSKTPHLKVIGFTTIKIQLGAATKTALQYYENRRELDKAVEPVVVYSNEVKGNQQGRKWAFMASCSRGTGEDMYLKAKHAKRLLGYDIGLIICIPFHDQDWIETNLVSEFGVDKIVLLDDWPDNTEEDNALDTLLVKHEISDLYMLKTGKLDHVGSKLSHVRNLVHAIFYANEPHGDVFSRISKALPGTSAITFYNLVEDPKQYFDMSTTVSNDNNMDHPLSTETKISNKIGNMRNELNIPSDAIVFGRYGGYSTFDINFVRYAVKLVSEFDSKRYFLFMNTEPFCCYDFINQMNLNHSQVIFLPATGNKLIKLKFVNTCDAMLHARSLGETFGSALAEFSIMNRPIITYATVMDGAHLSFLNNKALLYHDMQSLIDLLLIFNHSASLNPSMSWNQVEQFTPENMMLLFDNIYA